MCQIASFYAGAMSEARNIELAPIADRLGGLDLVLIGANDPAAMLRHTEECRERGYAFAADPSQQLARMSGEDTAALIAGAEYLLTNEYEKKLLESKTGLTDAQVREQVKVRVTTLGSNGVRIDGEGVDGVIEVPVAQELRKFDPTGVGDGFRAGFFAGLSWELDLERSAQVGSLVATYIIETAGAQEYAIEPAKFVERFAGAYGPDAADELRPHLPD
jgi:adenosine kinase